MSDLAPGRYAAALFSIALEEEAAQEGALNKLAQEAAAVLAVIDDNKEFNELLLHPRVSAAQKSAAVRGVFGPELNRNLYGLFDLVFIKGRQKIIAAILEAFLERAREYENIAVAYIESAAPLTDGQIADMSAALSKKLNKRIEARTSVDPRLIGGARVRVDGFILDGTLKKRISDMKLTLLNKGVSC